MYMPSIIYEDNHLIAANKPAGMLVHGDKTGDFTLAEAVKQYIKERYNKPGDVFLGVIHRLDRPVSGAIVFARTSKALQRMNKLFHEKKITKKYWMISDERPEPINGTISHFLLKDKSRNFVKVFDRPGKKNKKAKKATLTYKMIAEVNNKTLIEVDLLTGRPHQIRAQMSAIGCPVKNDVKYGYRKGQDSGIIFLHSKKIEFLHPVKKVQIEIEADPPEYKSWNLFDGIYE